MFGWMIGGMALRGLRNAASRPRTPHGPKYVQPYKGRRKKTYNVARFVITVGPLIPLAMILITLCLAK